MKRILVTGAVGQIGSELTTALRGRYGGDSVVASDVRMPTDPALRDEVVARYKQLDLPTYAAGINPELTAELDPSGNTIAVRIAYPRDPVRQYLAYGNMYRQR